MGLAEGHMAVSELIGQNPLVKVGKSLLRIILWLLVFRTDFCNYSLVSKTDFYDLENI